MFGNPARASWGTSQWGAILPDPGALFSLDSVCSGDLDRTISLDAIVGLLDAEASMALDGIASGDLDSAFALDASVGVLPAEVYAQLTTSPYVLVELDLQAGPIKVATKHRCALGRTFSARLLKSGKILRTIGKGTDSLRLELDDTTTNGAERFRDLFSADDPEGSLVRVWVGAEGARDQDHVLVFEGKIEGVQSFSNTVVRIMVVRREQVEDVLLGQLVDEVAFPEAPSESISTMLPIVFGVLDAHEGVVINTLEVGSLLFNIFATDTVIALVDGSAFPASGTVRIDAEQIAYTGKSGTGDVLVGLTRGFSGTNAADHPKGAEVAEVGIFQVKLASHGLGFARKFKLQLPNGNLGDPVPQPTTIDPANALATWADGLPQIRDPDARPTYQRIHFKDVDPTNTATNPQFAARESLSYEAFKVAQVPIFTNLVLLTNTDNLSEAGDIQRVWIGVLFDPKSISVGFVSVANAVFTLLPFDTVPEEITRNDERTGDRIYDVPPPVIDVQSPAGITFSATPQVVAEPGVFVTARRAGLAVDKDDDSFACYQFVGLGESIIGGGGNVVYRWTEDEWRQAFPLGSFSVEIEMRLLMGTTTVPISSPWNVSLRLDGAEIANTRIRCSSKGAGGNDLGFIQGRELFTLDVSGTFDPFELPIKDPLGNDINIWDRLELVLSPVTGVSSGMWCAHEVSIQGLNEPPIPVVSATQDVRNSVSNYFEVTSLLPTVNGQKDWGAFSDLNLLGRAAFQGGQGQEALILETFWVVEFTPFVAASSKVPRVFADVSGKVPSGNPVEVARALITGADPEGMGLPATRIDQAAYLTASASLVADGVRVDFALRKQTGVVSLLSDLAAQADMRDTWENERHRLVRLPRADVSLPTARLLTCGDIFSGVDPATTAKSLSRSSVRGVANRLTVTYRPFAPTGETSKTFTLNDAPSQASKLGIKEAVLELGLIQADAAANLVAQRKIERVRVPRWIVEYDVPIYALAFRVGDLVTSTDPDFAFEVGEITQVNLSTDRLKTTRVQVVVWKK